MSIDKSEFVVTMLSQESGIYEGLKSQVSIFI